MTATTYASTDHSGNPAFSDRVTSEYLTAPARREATMGSGYADVTVTIPGGFWLASFAAFFVFIVSLFDLGWLYSHSFRTIGLVVTVFATILAALSLTLDFGSIDAGVESGAPKFMEWYSAYGLMVTLIWLYLLILRLLAVLSRNR
jgi:uncharacterized YccA/Bax inhibitor family protein